MSGFQPDDAGSIPATCSIESASILVLFLRSENHEPLKEGPMSGQELLALLKEREWLVRAIEKEEKKQASKKDQTEKQVVVLNYLQKRRKEVERALRRLCTGNL